MLSGVHSVTRTLSDGRKVVYHYAWKGKGAPRLQGGPGSPEFIASYHQAHAGRKRPRTGTLRDVITAFKASADFTRLGHHTDRSYRRHLDDIQTRFGDMPLKALDDPRVRRHFLKWRDSMRDTPRTADYAIGTLKRLLSWAVERVYVQTNQAEPIKRLHTSDRSDSIWTDSELQRFALAASKELTWAVQLAAHTGLRQSDLIVLTWNHYDGESIALRTSKRGKEVLIPATPACIELLADIEHRHLVILTTERGKRPWTADGLRSSFRKACKTAGINRTFHDLRRTAATRLVSLGHPAPVVAMVMGWEERAVDALKRRYVSRSAVARSVLARSEKGG